MVEKNFFLFNFLLGQNQQFFALVAQTEISMIVIPVFFRKKV